MAAVAGARRFAVWVEASKGVALVVKQGWGATASSALQREAAVLGAFRHPGAVELVSVGSAPPDALGFTRLVTRFAGAHTLGTAPPATARLLVLRSGQVLATLAALHSRGLLHGAVDPSHIVVGPTGSARWCGLGRVQIAAPEALDQETRVAADLAAGALLTARFSHYRATTSGRAERRLVHEALDVLTDDRLDAAGMASTLTTLLPRVPPGARRFRRRTSAKTDGDLVGEQPASDGQHQVLAAPLHEAVEDPADLLR